MYLLRCLPVTTVWVCLLVFGSVTELLYVHKDLSNDDKGFRKTCLGASFGICLILKGCD